MKKIITIEVESDAENERIKRFVEIFCIDNFQKKANIKISEELNGEKLT